MPRDVIRPTDPKKKADREREERIRCGADLAGVSISEFLLRAGDAEARRLMDAARPAGPSGEPARLG